MQPPKAFTGNQSVIPHFTKSFCSYENPEVDTDVLILQLSNYWNLYKW